MLVLILLIYRYHILPIFYVYEQSFTSIIYWQEEKYEWGNPKSKGIIPDPTDKVEETIAAAAYRWRLRLLKEPNRPFHNMVALLLASGDKYDQFKRLIEAGGGKVVQAR